MKNKFKYLNKLYLKLIVSSSLIFLLLNNINVSDIFIALKNINLPMYLLALSISFLCTFIGAYRCKYLCKEKVNTNLPLIKSYMYYFYSFFYSNFLPTALGGDLLRVYYLDKHVHDKYLVSSIVLFERVSGFFSILLISIFSCMALFIKFGFFDFFYYTFFVGSLLFLGTSFILNQKCNSITLKFLNEVNLNVVSSFFMEITSNFKLLFLNTRLLLVTFILSLMYQLSGIFIAYLYGISLGIDVSIFFYLAFIPIIYIVTMIPVSLAGIGLRDFTIVLLFSLINISNHISLSLSIVIYLDMVIKGFLGGADILLSSFRT